MCTVSDIKSWFSKEAKTSIENSLKSIEKALTKAQVKILSMQKEEKKDNVKSENGNHSGRFTSLPGETREQFISRFKEAWNNKVATGEIDKRPKSGLRAKTNGIGVVNFFEDRLQYVENGILSLDELQRSYEAWSRRNPYVPCKRRRLSAFLDPKRIKSTKIMHKDENGWNAIILYTGVDFKKK